MATVSALLLSLGEPFTVRARDSLRRQTRPVDILEVNGVSPFGLALNSGASQLTGEFFVQCDADMILRPHCVERLLAAMVSQPKLGMVVGHLLDPLQGHILGVKLYRSRVYQQYPLGSEPDCETLQVAAFQASGWEIQILDDVLGEHRPDTRDEVYHFERFRLLGLKARRRQGWWDITTRLLRLREHFPQPAAVSAAGAMLAGLTLAAETSQHSRARPSAECTAWQASRGGAAVGLSLTAAEGPHEAFLQGWQRSCGVDPRVAVETLLSIMHFHSWCLLTGLVGGLLAPEGVAAEDVWARVAPWAAFLSRNLESLSGVVPAPELPPC